MQLSLVSYRHVSKEKIMSKDFVDPAGSVVSGDVSQPNTDTGQGQAAQTQVTDAQRALPPVPAISADAVVSEMMAVLPQLGSARDQLRLIIGIWLAYLDEAVVKANGGRVVPNSETLTDLEVFQRISVNMIQDALHVLKETTLNSVWTQLRGEFEAVAGPIESSSVMDFDMVRSRLAGERAEQDVHIALAQSIIALVMEICNRLVIQNPDPGLAPNTPMVETRGASITERLLSTAQRAGLIDTPVVREAVDTVKHDWHIEPLLRDNDPLVVVVRRIHAMLERNTPEVVWVQLEANNMSSDYVIEILATITATARKQLVQSTGVMQHAEREAAGFAGRIEMVQRLQQIIDGVESYLFP